MRLSAIFALSDNRVIGRDNQLPWHLPADLAHFKKITLSHPIVMGRKTHESIGRPLPGRQNIVVTRDLKYEAPGCIVVHTIQSALFIAEEAEELFIIGGEELYRALLPQTQRLYVTEVHAQIEGDAYFPEINPKDWSEVEREDHPADADHIHPYSFRVLDRKP